jgi:hypothetical protein
MPILEEDGPDDMLFQQDGAPPHFHKEVTDFLNRNFSENWIDRAERIIWPPRSPDLTPLDFSFGGTSRMLCTCHHWLLLCRNLLGGDAESTVILDLLYNVWTENYYRYDICRATHGALIEHM